MLSFHLSIAFVVATAAAVVIWFRWDEMDLGQRIYACVLGVLLTFLWLYVPFRIPTTGEIVHSFVWQPVTYTDERMKEILTPEVIAEVQREIPPQHRSEDWVRKSVTRVAWVYHGSLFSGGHRTNLMCLLLFGVAGWFIIPPFLNRFFFNRWHGRS